jgi:hypothetical protein
VCDQVTKDIFESSADPAVLSILGSLNGAIMKIVDVISSPNQISNPPPGNPVPAQNAVPAPVQPGGTSGMVCLGTISKKQRTMTPPAPPAVRVEDNTINVPVVQSETDEGVTPEILRFREAVRDAERSTLIFNLDMGKVPIMNVESMSRKATLALTSMAAKVEECSTSIPSEDSVAIIDDVLSLSSGIKFFGATTKSYRKTGDKNSGSFCTVPVKYEFQDKDTRIRAEKVLRATCGVNCTTPYPPILRECIRRTVDMVKKDHPEGFVKVTVDLNNHCLRVARKANKDSKAWIHAKESIPIPPEALDIRSKKVPETLNLSATLYSPKKVRSRSEENSDMDNEESG